MVSVKVCGITTLEDALQAARLGADALGFIFAPSPRRVSADQVRRIVSGLPETVTTVGVFVNASLREIFELRAYCGLDVIQLHGDETEEFVTALDGQIIKALRVRAGNGDIFDGYPSAIVLLDTYSREVRGGTGKPFDWGLAVDAAKQRPVILSGGLSPDNVADAIASVAPCGVDVGSGVESEPGRKDYARLSRFIRTAKSVGGASRWAWPFRPVRRQVCA